MMNDKKHYLSQKEVAEFLGCSVGFLKRQRAHDSNPIPYIRIGNLIRYELEEVQDWLNTKKQKTQQQGGVS